MLNRLNIARNLSIFKPLKIATPISCILLASLGANSHAEEPGRFYINPAVGYQVFDSDRTLDDSITGIIGGEYVLTEKWGVEATYLRSSPDGEDDTADADLDQYRLGALYYLPETNNWKPFLAASLAEGQFDYDGQEHEETQLHLGGGARYSFNNDWSGRLEARAINSLDEEAWDALVSVGISYAFGGSDSRSDYITPAAVAEPLSSDKDNDGVTDSKDQCPTTPNGVSVNNQGCALDSDNDGIADYLDKCPGTPAKVAVNNQGCPVDSDNDGVADYLDKCPKSKPGEQVDQNGCKVLVEKTVSIDLAINFATNSYEVPQDEYSEIKKVAEFMEEYPSTKVTIEGHTDNRGNPQYNKSLSQRRADSVVKILTQNYGVSSDRVTAKGYGEEKPIADNSTATGRKQNRRVVAEIEHSYQQ